jgi:hypothetical protein
MNLTSRNTRTDAEGFSLPQTRRGNETVLRLYLQLNFCLQTAVPWELEVVLLCGLWAQPKTLLTVGKTNFHCFI